MTVVMLVLEAMLVLVPRLCVTADCIKSQMLNIMTSPNDPIFWLHHAYLDYVRYLYW